MGDVKELMKCIHSGGPMPCACGLSANNGVSIADINKIYACSDMAGASIKCTYCQLEKPSEISASELIAKYPSLSLAAIGIMLFTNVLHGKLGAEEELIKFFRATSKKMRYETVENNKVFLDKVKNTKDNKNVGISPSGKIASVPPKEPWWKFLVEILMFIVAAGAIIVAIIFPAAIPAILCVASILAMVSTIMSTIASILMNSNISTLNRKALQIVAEIAPMINPMYDVAGFIVDVTYVHPWEKNIPQERLRNGEIAKAVLSTVLTIAVSAASFNVSGIAMKVQQAVSIVQGALSIVSGAFEIARGVKGLKVADEVFDIDRLKAVIEAEKEAIQNLSDLINTIIQGLNTDTSALAMEFAKMSDVVKLEGDTRTNIARNITI